MANYFDFRKPLPWCLRWCRHITIVFTVIKAWHNKFYIQTFPFQSPQYGDVSISIQRSWIRIYLLWCYRLSLAFLLRLEELDSREERLIRGRRG
jgi:hypothetical protein